MIEVSATAAPALLLPGTVLAGAGLPAAPAVAGAEGAQLADFSALLTGSVLAIEAPATPEAQPAPVPAPIKLTPAHAVPTGKTGVAGKPNGKILPDGKLPVTQELAVSDTPASETPQVDPIESDAAAAVETVAPLQSTSAAAPEAHVAQPTSVAMASQEQRTASTLPAKNTAPTPKNSHSKTVPQAARTGSASPIALCFAPAEAATPPIHIAKAFPVAQVPTVPTDPAPAQPSPAAPTTASVAVPFRSASSAPLSTATSVPQPATILPQGAMIVSEVATTTAQAATIVPQTPTILLQAAPAVRPVGAAPIAEQTASTAAIATVLSAPALMPTKSVRVAIQVAPDEAQPAGSATAMPQEPAAKLVDSFTPRTAGDLPLMRVAAAVPGQALPVEHKSTEASLTPAVMAAVPSDATVQPARSDIVAPISPEQRAIPTMTAINPTMPTQDVAALVDRITEARAAAAPQSIRAALMHEDFGAISLNLRAEDSHIHVTLGSADPTFAPAVHAAAAASLGANADEPSRDGARRDAFNQQQQDTSSSSNTALQQQASNQQASRDRAGPGERSQPREQSVNHPRGKGDERGPSTPASPRRSGIYA